MRTWLFVGSSPGVLSQYQYAIEAYDIDATITSNRGVKVCERPEYYFLLDQGNAPELWEIARRIQIEGCKLVTTMKNPFPVRLVNPFPTTLTWFDIFLDETTPLPEGYGGLNNSGQYCMAYAAKQGIDRLVLAGCEGYDENGSYFDASDTISPDKCKSINKSIIRPHTQLLCDTFPHVEFICLGNPNYQIDASNWKIESCGRGCL